jgi:hypothetical protein
MTREWVISRLALWAPDWEVLEEADPRWIEVRKPDGTVMRFDLEGSARQIWLATPEGQRSAVAMSGVIEITYSPGNAAGPASRSRPYRSGR